MPESLWRKSDINFLGHWTWSIIFERPMENVFVFFIGLTKHRALTKHRDSGRHWDAERLPRWLLTIYSAGREEGRMEDLSMASGTSHVPYLSWKLQRESVKYKENWRKSDEDSSTSRRAHTFLSWIINLNSLLFLVFGNCLHGSTSLNCVTFFILDLFPLYLVPQETWALPIGLIFTLPHQLAFKHGSSKALEVQITHWCFIDLPGHLHCINPKSNMLIQRMRKPVYVSTMAVKEHSHEGIKEGTGMSGAAFVWKMQSLPYRTHLPGNWLEILQDIFRK